MTRVLWVTAEVPHHTGWGGRIRQAHLLDALAPHAEIDLLVTGRVVDPAVRTACATVTEVAAAPVGPEPGIVRRVRTLVPSPPAELRLGRPHREALARALPSPVTHDVVVVEHNELVPLLPARAADHPSRWVLDLHHLLSVRHAHEAARTGGRSRAYHRVEARRGRRLERQVATRADRVLVCSPEDAAVLGGRATVIPNGVDLAAFRPTPVPAAPRIVFTGHLGYTPNIDGVRWFAQRVLPRVRAAVPDVAVDVVGAVPTPEVVTLTAAEGLALHPDVDSVVPYLAGARVAIVPVHIGSGTRLKALDAMASGRAVVGTTIGLEGLGVVDGTDALVADDPATFADAVIAVLSDDTLAARLGQAGRATAAAFGWDPIGDRFVTAVLGH